MCGIAATLLHPQQRTAEEWQAICTIFSQNLLFNEERGRAASGVALIRRDGSSQVLKRPVPASELIRTDAYQEILASVGPETVCLLGHTRMPTKGSRWNNDNNHPLQGTHTLGIHNGNILNDDALFAKLRLPRGGKVDSEIIFRLLDSLPPSLNAQYLPRVREKMRLLEGKMVSMAVDLRNPTRLLVVKRNNPLSLHYEASLRALFFSSRYLFLRKTFGRSVITEVLANETLYAFDAAALAERGKCPAESLAL